MTSTREVSISSAERPRPLVPYLALVTSVAALALSIVGVALQQDARASSPPFATACLEWIHMPRL